MSFRSCVFFFFFFKDTAPPEIYPLPLPDPLPICPASGVPPSSCPVTDGAPQASHCASDVRSSLVGTSAAAPGGCVGFDEQVVWSNPTQPRSEEHTPELHSPDHLLCRLLL